MASLVVFFLLFILPFVIAPFGITQFENPKVIFAEGGIILLLLILLCKDQISFHNRSIQIILYCVIIVVTLSNLFFFRTNLSFFGNAFRMQGIVLLWFLLLFSFLSSQLRAFRISGWIYLLLLGIETVVLFFLPLNASQRYVGTLGEPNALSAFAVFLFPFGWFGIQKNQGNFMERVLLLVLVGTILYLSGSRSGMIAFGIELAFLVGTYSNTFLRSLKKTTIICIFLYILSYSLPFFEQVPYENRSEIWQSAVYAGLINPALGQGFGNTEIALHNAATGLDLPIHYFSVDSSHNIFLDWWVQGGVVGVSTLLILVYLAFHQFMRTNNIRELTLLLGMLTVLSFNPASVVGLLGFWWLIGQGLKDLY